MRKFRCFWGLLIGLAISVSAHADAKSGKLPTQLPTVQAVLKEVQSALADVQERISNARLKDPKLRDLPALSEVKLSLQTVDSVTTEGKVEVFVVTIDGKAALDNSQQLVLTFTPPPPGTPTKIAAINLQQSLEDAIFTGWTQIASLTDKDRDLDLKSLAVTVGFTVTTTLTGDASPKFLPVTLGVSLQGQKKAVQEITITYAKPMPKP